jgi:hypothetical protein
VVFALAFAVFALAFNDARYVPWMYRTDLVA